MSAIFAQRLTGPLASLNVTWRRVSIQRTSASRLENGSSVWDSQSMLLQDELEMMQKRAARFVTGNSTFETRSITSI